MYKKILISTALSGALLFSSARAVTQEFTYNGNDTFTFNNVQYNGLDNLFNTLVLQNFDFSNNDVRLAEGSQRAYLNALKNAGSNERNSFIQAVASGQGIDLNLARSVIERALDLVNNVEANGIDTLEYFDFHDFFESDYSEIQEMAAFISNLQLSNDLTNELDLQVSTFETDLAANNQDVKALVDEKVALNAVANKSAEQLARIQELTRAIVSRSEYNDIRNSVSTQETLRVNLEQFKRAMEANENSSLSAKGREDLANFVETLDKYVVTNPTTSSELPAVQQEDGAASNAIVDTLIANRALIDSRISDFAGVSAGDIMENYGVWLKGSLTQATQKSKGGTSKGYKLDSRSVTIGLDTGDDSLVGIAYSFAQNDVKNKTGSQNKDDITSHTMSAYGKYVITPEIFVSGQGQFGIAEIKKKRATGDATNSIATAKPKATILGAKAEIGYNYPVMQNLNLTPTAGVAYSDVKVKSYKESGPGLNREVGKISSNRTSLVAALSAKYMLDMGGDMKIYPEIHAGIDYAFNTKNSNTLVTILDGIAPITTPVKKAEKARYNLGTMVKLIGSEKYEFTAGYDLGLAKKFQSHTGTLKVRVNL